MRLLAIMFVLGVGTSGFASTVDFCAKSEALIYSVSARVGYWDCSAWTDDQINSLFDLQFYEGEIQPDDFIGLESLREIEISPESDENLEVFRDEFVHTPKLSRIDLRYFESLPTDFFKNATSVDHIILFTRELKDLNFLSGIPSVKGVMISADEHDYDLSQMNLENLQAISFTRHVSGILGIDTIRQHLPNLKYIADLDSYIPDDQIAKLRSLGIKVVTNYDETVDFGYFRQSLNTVTGKVVFKNYVAGASTWKVIDSKVVGNDLFVTAKLDDFSWDSDTEDTLSLPYYLEGDHLAFQSIAGDKATIPEGQYNLYINGNRIDTEPFAIGNVSFR
ncbi:MAG: hypothetical protein KDD25_04575 [Bdellovibrionales bacterium]|nr:hypothetical protein [Bdellovibrionales bacterium]